ncbi:sensor histidine kinase [Rhodococcus marinonascens]|uniref:sensor histidine kinase n=1 Tax=Rhodococcus marinonascens TaxID=38311 RepID=UPI00093348C9|nr:sensor histidine kinase [Rhodococcus marinonascens]
MSKTSAPISPLVEFLRKTWREAAYLAVTAVGALAGFIYLAVGLGIGLGLAVTLVGLPLLAAVVVSARGFGYVHRSLATSLMGATVGEPPQFTPRPGVIGFVRSGLTDRTAWRAIMFVLIKGVVGFAAALVALVFAAVALYLTISPILWRLLAITKIDSTGAERHSIIQIGNIYFDTWPQMLLVSAIGIGFLLIAPWPIRGLAALDRALIHALLGPSRRDSRVEELELSRTAAVENSATRLRRVERDLHDGTQARIVAMAMTLGRAEERLAAGQDPSDLVHSAHSAAKDTPVELRELVRGIHPPALDLGLAPALETLAARCAIPVELTVSVESRPSPGIEVIAYFTVAELLTNVARHSGATRAWVSATSDGGTLSVTVRDNGTGGARVGAGSGLSGLETRASTVDGTLSVHSPVGGPTIATLFLPVDGAL